MEQQTNENQHFDTWIDKIIRLFDSSGLNVPPVAETNVPGIAETNVPTVAE